MKSYSYQLLLFAFFISADAIAQPQCTGNVPGNFFDYDTPLDYLFEVETQNTCVTDMPISPSNLDYMTAHTTRIQYYGDVIIDEAINLSKIFMQPGNCGGVSDIENIFVNISVPDPDLATLTDTNYETIYDLKKTNNPNHIIGTGVYYELANCVGSGGTGGIFGGPSPTTNISIPWPFYFKFDLLTNSFIYFKRLRKPGGASCTEWALDAIPVDIELIDNSEYVICLSGGADRGLLRIDANSGTILGIRKYRYGQNQYFNPVDVEVHNNKIYAVGKIQLKPSNTFYPALLSTDDLLTGQLLKRYDPAGPNTSDDYLKMSGVKVNPVSNSLLMTGWTFNGVGAIMAIHIENLNTLEVDWQRVIRANLPNAIHIFGWTYGLTTLQGTDNFALHAYGSEIYGLDAMNTNYLVTMNSQENGAVGIRGLHNGFHADAKNSIPVNSTLVQSPRTGNLGLVMHRDETSNPFTNINFLNTNLSTNTEDCLGPLTPDVDTYNSEAHVVPGLFNAGNSVAEESIVPLLITETPVNWNIKCYPPAGNDGPGGGLGAKLKKPTTEFTISPNPAADFIYLDVVGDYQIYDLQGQIKMARQQVKQIDISEFSAGIYFIMNERGQTKKLVIQ